jgi:hypothetical protein
MKKVKMGLMALAALTGMGSAFAAAPRHAKNATTYYAIKSGSSFVWRTSPAGHCLNTAVSATCTITTAVQPTDGVVPAGHAVTFQNYK